eukprot:snap_masked-scaffold_2-processed-gene-16.28-mRNA-1 protein AED:1.00 eAED:1.00 QI:0/-1/0/0/-1/1/1/0/59
MYRNPSQEIEDSSSTGKRNAKGLFWEYKSMKKDGRNVESRKKKAPVIAMRVRCGFFRIK